MGALRLIAATALVAVVSCGRSEPPPKIVRLFVSDGGRGLPAAVFIHSLAGHTGHWADQLSHVRLDRRAIALDLRGHGRSPAAPDSDYSVPAMARDVAAALDTLRLERFALVGHSIGALVALEYAAAHPERVTGVLLLDPAGDARNLPADVVQNFLAGMEADYAATIEGYWRQNLEGSRPSVRDSVLADLRATPRAVVEGAFRALLTYDPLRPLAAYKGPVRALITRLNEVPTGLPALVPSLPRRKLDGTGHWLQIDKPDEVNRAIDEFLRAVERRR